MDIRIGIREVAREVALESAQSPDEVERLVQDALKSGEGTLRLEDNRGRRVVIPVAAIGYVEIGESERGRVGFGS